MHLRQRPLPVHQQRQNFLWGLELLKYRLLQRLFLLQVVPHQQPVPELTRRTLSTYAATVDITGVLELLGEYADQQSEAERLPKHDINLQFRGY